ncbi:MAG: MBL fold metallo-hydrolase [Syntrophomonadales bacterium]|jgi:glyoxylase-like metal-dependent hydrolase (beta-lactamase superfamily II)
MLSVEEYDQVLAIYTSHRLFGRKVSQAFVYLVDGLLIDTGLPRSSAELVELITGHELKLIVNTYHNPESIGNNALLQRTFSVPIRAHKEAVEKIKYPRQEGIVRRWLWGQPLTSKVSKLKSIIRFKDYYFRVYETFGIGYGHICLFEPDRGWLFSGRLLADQDLNKCRDLGELRRDLKRMLSLQPRMVFCASNGVLNNGVSVIESKLRTLEMGIHDEVWDDAWSLSH